MAIYAVGDVQGCYDALQRLLERIRFDPASDQLWLAGDLVNRGPDSLSVLRFIRQLGSQAIAVLGNHDLHLLAIRYGQQAPKNKDTLDDVLSASDSDELLDWLRRRPLLHHAHHWCMTHAGLPPQWSMEQAQSLASEVEQCLRSDKAGDFFAAMYGNEPNLWNDHLTGQERLRAIVNYLTRMRFVDQNGRLELRSKESAGKAPEGCAPWFSYQRKSQPTRLLFGHWAALEGHTGVDDIIALDTGCVWGGQLSALRLDDQRWFRVNAES